MYFVPGTRPVPKLRGHRAEDTGMQKYRVWPIGSHPGFPGELKLYLKCSQPREGRHSEEPAKSPRDMSMDTRQPSEDGVESPWEGEWEAGE